MPDKAFQQARMKSIQRSSCEVTPVSAEPVIPSRQPNEPQLSDKSRIARTWQQYYEDRGYGLWGFSPSPTARTLAEALLKGNRRRSERVEIIDWGCGYGRDSLYFVELGFDVIGIDVSAKAIALARAAYKQRQESGVPLVGSASFHAGDMRSVFRSRAGQKVCAFFSNRVLHLLSETDFRQATREAIRNLDQDAYFCVSARSPDDFDPTVMEWMPGKEEKLAKYRDSARDGHEIAFVTKERLLGAVGHNLRDTSFLSATEPERVGSQETHLLVMMGRTKHQHENL